jgi:hypothetical protein
VGSCCLIFSFLCNTLFVLLFFFFSVIVLSVYLQFINFDYPLVSSNFSWIVPSQISSSQEPCVIEF